MSTQAGLGSLGVSTIIATGPVQPAGASGRQVSKQIGGPEELLSAEVVGASVVADVELSSVVVVDAVVVDAVVLDAVVLDAVVLDAVVLAVSLLLPVPPLVSSGKKGLSAVQAASTTAKTVTFRFTPA